MANSTPFLTAFLPWLQLKQPASVLEVTFVPLRGEGKNSAAFESVKSDLENILSGYVDIKGKAVRNPTMVCIQRNNQLTWEMSDAEHELITLAVNFLMLAGFS